MTRRLPIRMLALTATTALLGTVALTPAAGASQAVSHPSVTSTTRQGDQQKATATLTTATALFSDTRAARIRRASGAAPSGRDATMVLRDLAQERTDLPTSAQRTTAARILARPTFGAAPAFGLEHSYTVAEQAPVCSSAICVHHVSSTDDASTDAYVAAAVATMAHVYDTEVTRMGYRAPLSDAAQTDNGGDGRLDVYLQNLPSGLYGYCAPDTGDSVTSGYCVLDNDYKKSDFPTNTPVQNLDVTAAHEFFHAVQFGYDATEDLWLMEGTAAWMEDEVYDGVNDDRQYLTQSPLTYPFVPLDYSDDSYLPYGAWIYWKHLSESAGRGSADDPAIVRAVWEHAVGSTYSTQALSQVLRARGTTFAKDFAAFSTWTRNPRTYFAEGRHYPAAPLDKRFRLSARQRTTGTWRARLDHMSSSFVRFAPTASLKRGTRLRLWVELPRTSRGSVAQVVVHKKSGRLAVKRIKLTSTGRGSRTFAFSRARVAYVELDMVDASTRFVCDQGTYESCSGVSKDDDLPARFRARAIS